MVEPWLDVADKVASLIGATAGIAGLVLGVTTRRQRERRGTGWLWLAVVLGAIAITCGVLRLVGAGAWGVSLAGLAAGGGCAVLAVGAVMSRGRRMTAHPIVRRLVAAQWEEAFRHQYDFVLGSAPPLSEIYVEQKADFPLGPEAAASVTMVTLREMAAQFRHALIVADPGTGKSTALARIATEQCAWLKDARWFARTRRAPYGAVVPVLLPAAALAVRGLSEALADRCAAVTGREVDRELFERAPPHADHWLVLVDGVDQVLTTRDRTRLLTLLGNRMGEAGSPYRFVVATRPLAFGELGALGKGGVGRFTLRRFDADDLEAFASRWADYRSRTRARDLLPAQLFLARVTSARLSAIARVPLLATIAALLLEADRERELPGSRTELYQRCVDHLLYGRAEMLEQRRKLAAEFAGHGAAGEQAWAWLEDNFAALLEGVAESHLSAADTTLLADAQAWVRHHAPPGMFDAVAGWERHLRALLEASGVVVFRIGGAEFLHQSFAEYLAAGPRARAFDRDTWLADLRGPDSRSLALFVLGRSLFDVDPMVGQLLESGRTDLAGEIIADGVPVNPRLHDRVIDALVEQVVGEEWTAREALELLAGLASDPKVFNILAGIADSPDHNPWVRVYVADALCDTHRDGIIRLRRLSDATSSAPEEVRRWAARRLRGRGVMTTDEIYQLLDSELHTTQECRRLVEDSQANPVIRLRAALLLAEAGEPIIDWLEMIFADPRLSNDARLGAARRLRRLGDTEPELADRYLSLVAAWQDETGNRSSEQERRVDQLPAVWGNVPPRNPYFTGRERYLRQLREDLVSQETVALLPTALHGMGGIGKTHIAVEYIYRYAADYQLIWWVPARDATLMVPALAALASRLGLETQQDRGAEQLAKAVVDALSRGDPFDNWLLVFDQANSVDMVERLLPRGPGHVVLTARNPEWIARGTKCIEVGVFDRSESHMFLRRRIPGITADDSDTLAERLGDLPLALEVAGAFQDETGLDQDTYLEHFEEHVTRMLSEENVFGELGLAAAWGPTVARLRAQAPHAVELIQLCCFLGSEPISFNLLRHGANVLDPPLREILGDRVLLNRAARELSNFGLIQLDQRNKSLQISALNVLTIRDNLSPDETDQMRHRAHLLLAEANPGEPDNPAHHPRFAALLAYLDSARIWECTDDKVRACTLDIVRYLRVHGDTAAVHRFAGLAIEAWTQRLGPDHPDVQTMTGYQADAGN